MPLLSSDMSDYDYDFSQFGHWDGDSASYYEEYDHYSPSVLPHLRPKSITPLASPPAFVQKLEQGPSSTDTQDKYTLTNAHDEPPSRPPSPTTCPTTPRPATPLEYEGEAFPPLVDIWTQEGVHPVPQEPTSDTPQVSTPPRIYHEPPTDPNDPELVELLTARRTNPLSLLAHLSLPASSPETEETNNSSNSGWGEEPNVGPCWCTQEVCICGYRPDTPPTPEGVVLWSPGVNYLPFRESVAEL
ncbi:hypothetical protein EDB89DRAFT_1902273 [Lactarius sanguifluus]|nr:hypothetical protein EDB89DRAFT_1902273 [Lactarius sanguifluus]